MFKKLKEKIKGDDQRPKGRPDAGHSQQQLHPNNPYYSSSQQQQHYTAPADKYQAPSGPPPNQTSSNSGYQAHPDPSLSHYSHQPPPSYEAPVQHNWQSIEEGDRAYDWCNANPLWPPYNIAPSTHAAIQNAQLALLRAPSFIGNITPQPQAGHWKVQTHTDCHDCSILTNLPMYSAIIDTPLRTQRPKTIYFELRLTGIGRGGYSLEEADAGIAVGFIAPPYPTFRLPGWQRGSLAIHGDDGRKYVNDTWGGVDFTNAFAPGDTVGIGMSFAIPKYPPSYEAEQQGKMLDVEVFFTRNGQKEGGWDGHEELDARSEGGTMGLRGDFDLFPAIGVFGGVDLEVFLHPSQWLYQPF